MPTVQKAFSAGREGCMFSGEEGVRRTTRNERECESL